MIDNLIVLLSTLKYSRFEYLLFLKMQINVAFLIELKILRNSF